MASSSPLLFSCLPRRIPAVDLMRSSHCPCSKLPGSEAVVMTAQAVSGPSSVWIVDASVAYVRKVSSPMVMEIGQCLSPGMIWFGLSSVRAGGASVGVGAALMASSSSCLWSAVHCLFWFVVKALSWCVLWLSIAWLIFRRVSVLVGRSCSCKMSRIVELGFNRVL